MLNVHECPKYLQRINLSAKVMYNHSLPYHNRFSCLPLRRAASLLIMAYRTGALVIALLATTILLASADAAVSAVTPSHCMMHM